MSMTREEAIKFAEHAVNITDIPEVKGFYRLASAALRPVSREQVDRMRGEWRAIHGLSEYYCSRCGEEFEIHAYDKGKYRFCPYCMSPMTDEAVDMVMERLEALKDGEND